MNITVRGLLVGTLLSWSMVGAVQAATVDFTNITDGDGSTNLFDVSATAPDPADGNKLIIGLNDFRANGASALTSSAVDTLSMTIDAPAGFFISSISYTEGGNGMTTDGVAAATGSIVVNNTPTNFLTQLFQPNANSGWTITPIIAYSGNKSSINVSITNSLFAFAFSPPPAGFAEIAKTSATLTVGIQAVPLPPAVWLFGSTLLGFVAFSRRRLS